MCYVLRREVVIEKEEFFLWKLMDGYIGPIGYWFPPPPSLPPPPPPPPHLYEPVHYCHIFLTDLFIYLLINNIAYFRISFVVVVCLF